MSLIATIVVYLDAPMRSGGTDEVFQIAKRYETCSFGRVAVYGDVGGYEITIDFDGGNYDCVSETASALRRAGYDIEQQLF